MTAEFSERELGRLQQQLETIIKNHDSVLAAQKDIAKQVERESKVSITIAADVKAAAADVERNTSDLKSFKTFVYERIQPKLEEFSKLSIKVIDNRADIDDINPLVSGLKTYIDKLEGSISVWKYILTPLALLVSLSSLILSIIKMVGS